MKSVKCVVVGDGGTGRTSLLLSFIKYPLTREYTPTVFDNSTQFLTVDGHHVSLSLWDTSGQEEYDRLRPLSYPQTDVFVVCFCVVIPTSFSNVRSKWIPELRHHCPNIPIILAGTKIDLREDPETINKLKNQGQSPITIDQGRQLAKEIGAAAYIETSALTHEGVQDLFETAVRVALSLPIKPIPPPLPKKVPPPPINIENSKIADELRKLLESKDYADVEFIVENSKQVAAHKIILCSASHLFCRIFGVDDSKRSKKKRHQKSKSTSNKRETKNEKEKENFVPIEAEVINSGMIQGFNHITSETDSNGKIKTIITLSSDIKFNNFMKVLEFLYTGTASIKDKNEPINEIMNTAEIFKCPELVTYCQNILNDSSELNPSIGTWLNDHTIKRCKNLFLNKPLLSDIKFIVEREIFYAHKAIVTSRCEVMKIMFGEGFVEHSKEEVEIRECSAECFLAFLEYLYTDHCSFEKYSDPFGILALADRYQISRLVTLCELYISKMVEVATKDEIAKANIDVIELLLAAQQHNAHQLAKFCLHFIAMNYELMKQRSEWTKLEGENLKWVEENQWPPKSYWKELEEYQKALEEFQKESEENKRKVVETNTDKGCSTM